MNKISGIVVPTRCPVCGNDLVDDGEDLVCSVCSEQDKFSKEILMIKFAMQEYSIYCDLDGVLALFDDKFKSLSGEYPDDFNTTHTPEEFWDVVDSDPEFWISIPPSKDGMVLWEYIKGFNPKILSTPGGSDINLCKKQKKDWVKKYLGSDIQVLFSFNKYKFANKSSILIDDMDKNLVPWEEHGGIGIKYINSDQATEELKKILGV